MKNEQERIIEAFERADVPYVNSSVMHELIIEMREWQGLPCPTH